jgi:hypothetical protein
MENNKNVPSGLPVSGPKFEPGASRIRSRGAIQSTASFGYVEQNKRVPYLPSCRSIVILITVIIIT